MKLKKKEKQGLLLIGLLTYISGAALFIFSKWVRVSTSVGEQRHPVEHWVRVSHTAVTYVIVIALGYMLNEHILPGLRSRIKKRVWSGLGNVAFFLVLIFTAVVILYGSDEGWAGSMSLTHSIVGLSCPLFIFFHLARRKNISPKVKRLRSTETQS